MSALVDPRGRVDWPECIGGPLDGDHYSRAWERFVMTKAGSRILLDSEGRLYRDADAELSGAYVLDYNAVPWRFVWYRFPPDESHAQADGAA